MKTLRYTFYILFVLSATSITAFAQGGRLLYQARKINFNTVTIGKSAQKLILLSNFDTAKSVHVQLTDPTTQHFKLGTPDTFTVYPRQTDTVVLIFQPQVVGLLNDSIILTHDGDTLFAKSPSIIRMSGAGQSAVGDTIPKIAISAQSINFRVKIDSSTTKQLLILNASDTTNRLKGNISGLHAPFSLVSKDSTFDLAKGDTAAFSFAFAPTEQGTFIDTLTVLTNSDSAHRAFSVFLVGMATSPPAPKDTLKIAVSISNVDFGTDTVGSGAMRSFSLMNTSAKMADTVTGLILAPKAPFALDSGAGSFVLPDSASKNIVISFKPSTAGTFYDSITVLTNATDAPSKRIIIHIAGIGIAASTPTDGVREAATHSISLIASPNPSLTHTSLYLQGEEYSVVRLIGVNGENLGIFFQGNAGKEGKKIELNTGSLAAGMYLLELRTASEVRTMKLMVQH